MADFTVSTDVDTLMKSADNATIKTQLDVVSPESVMNPMIEGMGLLNAFKGSAAAYSLRDINGSNPNVVRVRRTNNPDEADFTAADLASGAMLAWVGTGATDDGHVVTWYDQSGNGNDAIQGTTTSQPKIVDGGVYLGEVKFDGVNDQLQAPSLISASSGFSVFALAEGFVDETIGCLWSEENSLILGTSTRISAYVDTRTSPRRHSNYAPDNAARNVNLLNKSASNTPYLHSTLSDGSTMSGRLNGALQGSVSTPVGNNGVAFNIGRQNAGPIYLNGSISEIIVYDSNQSAARTYIEYNINNAYSIY